MKIVIFGLTLSSSWGNGHATLWRGLCHGLALRGHHVVFFERDVAYYRDARDLHTLDDAELVIYPSWEDVRERAERELSAADAVIVTSYCPDAAQAASIAASALRPINVFYDLDTPVTLALLERGQRPPYISEGGLEHFDLVLSFTGGPALQLLRARLGARHVAPLYGHVDARVHRPVPPSERYRSELSYLGTFSPDRQALVEELLFEPARLLPDVAFCLGGAQYPDVGSFPSNVVHHQHVPPPEHATFFCSSRATLNVTRDAMRRLGHCPSGRLFEAAACGVPLLSDWFEGLSAFFEPGREIEVVRNRHDVVAMLAKSDRELRVRAARARERVLSEHTAERRARELERLLAAAIGRVHHEGAGSVEQAAREA